jgi:hypothetical protein
LTQAEFDRDFCDIKPGTGNLPGFFFAPPDPPLAKVIDPRR